MPELKIKNFLLFLIFFISPHLIAKTVPTTLNNNQDYYNLSSNLEVLEDKESKFEISEIIKKKWNKKFKKNILFSDSYSSKSTFWVRVKIVNKLSSKKKWLISTPHYGQDEVSIFKNINNQWIESKTGNLLPFSSREINSRSFSFNISPKEKSTYFIRFNYQNFWMICIA